MHLLLIGLARSRPDAIRQVVVWCIWGVAWLGALIFIVATVRLRARQRRWLARVKGGRDPNYEILPLSQHPEWATAPPYLTARSYSGVLVYEPEDESEARELLGRVE